MRMPYDFIHLCLYRSRAGGYKALQNGLGDLLSAVAWVNLVDDVSGGLFRLPEDGIAEIVAESVNNGVK